MSRLDKAINKMSEVYYLASDSAIYSSQYSAICSAIYSAKYSVMYLAGHSATEGAWFSARYSAYYKDNKNIEVFLKVLKYE